jgi:hypothetical protein
VKPGDEVRRVFRVEDNSASPITGLTTSSFTVSAYTAAYGANFAAFTHASVVTELGSGWYQVVHAAPASAGWWLYRIVPNNTAYRLSTPECWSGELEVSDLDSLQATVAQGVATLSTTFQMGFAITGLQMVPYRSRTMTIAVTDQSGAAVDVSTAAYTNWRLAIRDKTQQSTAWEVNDGKMTGFSVTGSGSGALTIVIPESVTGPIYETWTASRTWSKGDYVVPTTSNGWIYQCTTAGTGTGVEPTWPTTEGNTVADGSATFTTRKRTIWLAAQAQEVGDCVSPKTGASAVLRQYWRCTARGTTSGSEPSWPSSPTVGQVLTDGTVSWKYQTDWFAALADPIASGNDTAQLYLELVADQLDTSKTVPVIRSSTFELIRREYEA